jgi:hypothetical protein
VDIIRRAAAVALATLATACGRVEPEPAPAPVRATPATPAAPAAPAAPGPVESRLDRITVIGASASAGYGNFLTLDAKANYARAPIDFADVLDGAVRTPRDAIDVHASALFFTNPMRFGPEFVDRALETEPTLVIAPDFLFWYAYGARGRTGAALASERDRFALLEAGLEQLDRIDAPLVVGDLPDMSRAIGMMLSARQVPRPPTLEALNERIVEWAAARDDVAVLPLRDMIRRMHENEAVAVGPWTWPAGSTSRLLRPDHLHPTVDGLVALAQLVAETAVGAGFGAPSEFEFDPDRVRAALEDAVARRHEEETAAAAPAGAEGATP